MIISRIIGLLSPAFFLLAGCLAYPDPLYADEDEIRIGVIASLDPVGGPWSISANLGFVEAAGEINKKGGIGGKNCALFSKMTAMTRKSQWLLIISSQGPIVCIS